MAAGAAGMTFDHRAFEIELLMDDRARRQAESIPRASYVEFSTAAMRAKQRQHEDPLGVDDDEQWNQPSVASPAEAFSVFMSALTHVGQQIAEVFNAVDWVALTRALETAQPTPEVRLEYRRHGHAAVCPRHGPTRGGSCWRCHR